MNEPGAAPEGGAQPPRRPPSRGRSAARWTLFGGMAGVLIVTGGLLLLTQTDRGRAYVLAITLDALAPRVEGTLRIERLAGNLFAGARIYNLELRALDGEPLILADSAFVNYGLRSLVAGDILLHDIVIWDAEVTLRRLPGEELWNFQKIFRDTTPDVPTDPRAVAIRSGRLVDVLVRVQTPWEPSPELPPAERERQLAAALSDTGRIVVGEVPGGYLRMERYRIDDAVVAGAMFAPDERGGTFVRITGLAGTLQYWRQPARVERADVALAVRDGRLELAADPLVLPDSRLSAGLVVHLDDPVRIDVHVETPGVAFADLQFLHPQLPAEGRVRGRLTVEDRPEGMLYLVRDLELEAPDTRVAGSFGVIVDDALRFVDVDLVAEPLRVETVEALLPVELPVRGLHIGAVEIRGEG